LKNCHAFIVFKNQKREKNSDRKRGFVIGNKGLQEIFVHFYCEKKLLQRMVLWLKDRYLSNGFTEERKGGFGRQNESYEASEAEIFLVSLLWFFKHFSL